MSFRTWHEYGFGIKDPNIETSPERIRRLLQFAPELQKRFGSWLEDQDSSLEGFHIDEVSNYDDGIGNEGILVLLREAIEEAEGIGLILCNDFDGFDYLIYGPNYPWHMNEKEKSLKEEDIENIFKKYISILTDNEIEVCYQECENGG